MGRGKIKIGKIKIGIVLVIVLLICGNIDGQAASKKVNTKKQLKKYYQNMTGCSNKKAFYVDITHDGKKDLIVTYDKYLYWPVHYVDVYTYKKGAVRLIYQNSGADFHAGGFIDMHLYKKKGKYYLVNKETNMWQGSGTVGYTVFYLKNTGKIKYLKKDIVTGPPSRNLRLKMSRLSKRYKKYCKTKIIETSDRKGSSIRYSF